MKKKNIEISIIVTTFNREKNIFQIINSLYKQNNIIKNFEIIICDSNSKNKIKLINLQNLFANLSIVYLNCKINHQAFKRNYGASKARGKYIIFIDDDCFPDVNFLYNHLKILRLNKKKIIYCGLVKYFIYKEVYNLIKYRESRLIKFNSKNKNNIPVKNFISMNMALNKDFFFQNKKKLFDNRFKYYGFEDFELAYRHRITSHYLLTKGLVYHKDKRNFVQFLDKYFYLGFVGITDIIRINLAAAKHSIFFNIENNFFIRILLRIPFIWKILNIAQQIIVFLEKYMTFYLPIIYKIGIFTSYLRGVVKRKENNSLYSTGIATWYK